MKKMKWSWLFWLIGIISIASVIFLINFSAMKSYSDLEIIYVANDEIWVDTKLEQHNFIRKSVPSSTIPSDAIRENELSLIEGKFARVTILEGQILNHRMVSTATSIRDITKNTGENLVSLAIPLDAGDMPLDVINNGDVVSMIGVVRIKDDNGQDLIVSDYTAENMKVAEIIEDSRSGRSKIIVLIDREAAKTVVEVIRLGRYNIVIDPNPFAHDQESR